MNEVGKQGQTLPLKSHPIFSGWNWFAVRMVSGSLAPTFLTHPCIYFSSLQGNHHCLDLKTLTYCRKICTRLRTGAVCVSLQCALILQSSLSNLAGVLPTFLESGAFSLKKEKLVAFVQQDSGNDME